jgi:hypothetical protein
MDSLLDWIEILFVLSIILLIVVYFIIKSQLRAKNYSKSLYDSRQLLQSIIDNTSNPILLKELTENIFYKQFVTYFTRMTQYKKQEDVADTYRNSDIEGKKIT